jgi:hypothetical protein
MDPAKRDYNMTDPELCMFASNLVITITRDQAQFTTRGVTAAMVTSFKALGDAFEVFPPDAYYLTDYLLATETKNVTRESLIIKLRAILGYAKIKYGPTSLQVKRFNAGDMTRQDDMKFLTTCRLAVKVANDYLADLTPIGLTAAMITDLTTTANTFESNLNSISSAQTNRDMKTQERISKGNELYSFVSRYCEIGKIIWEDVDPAKYNDYVIYDSGSSSLPKPKNLVANEMGGTPIKIRLTWDSVVGATDYDVYTSVVPLGAPSGVYTLLDNVADPIYNSLAAMGMRNYYKIMAKNASQQSAYSDEVWDEA